MVYYIFHGIGTAPEVTGGDTLVRGLLLQLLSVGRWELRFLLLFFIWYANAVTQFPEAGLGILSLLGASSRQLLIMVFLETLFIGIASLVVWFVRWGALFPIDHHGSGGNTGCPHVNSQWAAHQYHSVTGPV